jgi:hypothetical protein
MPKCLRCKGKILVKTARKYKGYSRYCAAIIKAERLAIAKQKGLPEDLTELANRLNMDYYIKKARSVYANIKIRVYEKEQFNYIYKAKGTNYYNKYLSKTLIPLIKATEAI